MLAVERNPALVLGSGNSLNRRKIEFAGALLRGSIQKYRSAESAKGLNSFVVRLYQALPLVPLRVASIDPLIGATFVPSACTNLRTIVPRHSNDGLIS